MSEKEATPFKFFASESKAEETPAAEPVTATDNPFIIAEENEEYKRIEKEFNEYKRKKVLSRIDSLIPGGHSLGDVKEEFRAIVASSRARAVTVPAFIEVAKKELPPIVRVEALIGYPYANGSKKAILYEIKAALQKGVDVSVVISLAEYASGNKKPLEKTLNIFKRYSKRRRLTPTFCVDALTREQVSRLAQILKENKATGVKLTVSDSVAKTADATRRLCEVLGEQCPVEVVGRISTAEDAEALFNAGAERIITTDYRTLIRQRLDNLTV